MIKYIKLWDNYVDASGSIAVDATVHSNLFKHFNILH